MPSLSNDANLVSNNTREEFDLNDIEQIKAKNKEMQEQLALKIARKKMTNVQSNRPSLSKNLNKKPPKVSSTQNKLDSLINEYSDDSESNEDEEMGKVSLT